MSDDSSGQGNETFGWHLWRARRLRRLTQIQLAEKLGVPYQYVQRWENDEYRPSMAYQGKIADFFGIDMETFLRDWMGEDI